MQVKLNEGEDGKNDLELQLQKLSKDYQELLKKNDILIKISDADTKKILQLQLDLEKLRLELRQTSSIKQDAETRLKESESNILAVEKKVSDRDRIIGEQKHLLDEIDKERDSFQRELDSKAEKLLELQGLIHFLFHFFR